MTNLYLSNRKVWFIKQEDLVKNVTEKTQVRIALRIIIGGLLLISLTHIAWFRQSEDSRLGPIVAALQNRDTRLQNWKEEKNEQGEQKRVEADYQIGDWEFHLRYEKRYPPDVLEMLLITYKASGQHKQYALRFDGGKVVLGEVINPGPDEPTARFESFEGLNVMNEEFRQFWDEESQQVLDQLSAALA